MPICPAPIRPGWQDIAAALAATAPPGRDVHCADLSAAALGPAAAMRFVLATVPAMPALGSSGSGATSDDFSDQAVGGDLARQQYGITGQGITVGILSDSFDLTGGYAADVADGALPAGIRVLEEGPAGSQDEGRAMAELVHRIAPGAQIMFHTATVSETDFASGIAALAAAGCRVIVDDVAYLDEPFFQTGSVLQTAVAQAVADGVSYFTAASNEGGNFYEAAFAPVATALPGLPGRWQAQNFGTAAQPVPYVSLSAPPGASFAVDLQWDQPFASIGTGHSAQTSLALALFTAGGTLIGTAGSLQIGGNPEQLLQFTNSSGSSGLRLAVVANSFAHPGLFKFIVYGSATLESAGAGQGSGTVTGHELVAGVNTVGAEAWSAAPRFGGSDTVESFSSEGPGTLLFDAAGNRLAQPQSAGKVNFLAPDGSSTSVFAPFYGTSAAAPDAAAVAALMLQANPNLTPAQITADLAQSAVAASGPAGSTGAGLIQAPGAVALALGHH